MPRPFYYFLLHMEAVVRWTDLIQRSNRKKYGLGWDLYKSKYNLSVGYQIGNTAESGIVKNYNPDTQILTIVYGLTTSLETIKKVDLNYTFFDESTPHTVGSWFKSLKQFSM